MGFTRTTIAITNYPSNSGYGTLDSAVADGRALEQFFSKNKISGKDGYEAVKVWNGLYDSAANQYAIAQRLNEIDNRDALSHGLLEVIPNWLTQGKTEPTIAFALRWMAGRRAGLPSFDPLYTIEESSSRVAGAGGF